MHSTHISTCQVHSRMQLRKMCTPGATSRAACLPSSSSLIWGKGFESCTGCIRPRARCSGALRAFVPVCEPYNPGAAKKYLGSVPEAPEKADLASLLPFLVKLALVQEKMYWRLWLVAGLILVSKAAGLGSPIFLKYAVESVAASNLKQGLIFLLLAGLARFAYGATKEVQLPIFSPVVQTATRRLAATTFAHILDLDIQYHLDRQSGGLSKILDRGTRSLQSMYRIVFFTFIPTMLELIFVAYYLGSQLGPQVSMAVVATFISFVTWTVLLAGMATKVRRQVNEYDNLTTAVAIDILQNIETVMLFGNFEYEVTRYDKNLMGYQVASVENERLMAFMNMGQTFILSVGLTATLVLTTLLAPGGTASAGSVVMAQGILLQLWAPLQFVGYFYREMRQSLVDIEEYLLVLKTESSLIDGQLCVFPPEEDPVELNELKEQETSNGFQENSVGLQVDIKNVHFGYSRERPILKDIDIRIKPGQSIALVGTSGSGKSTLMKLLGRLYDVDRGSIEFDGVDLRTLQVNSIRSTIGVVPQDIVLFNDTLLENIRYGRPSASDSEVFNAARMAELHLSISRMPKGYDTIVGDRGLKLSGGEMQRVAIARTFLRAPRLLLCDEATSSLDSRTEQSILASIKELSHDRTSIFIAHRLSTIQHCDLIVVMSEGRVVEQGTHTELMAKGGMYSQMWFAQAGVKKSQEQVLNPI